VTRAESLSAPVEPRLRQRLLCFVSIVLVFMLVGPPIGALVFMLTVALTAMGPNVDLAGLFWVGLFAMIYAVPVSYLIGVGPAAISGVVIGVRQAFFGPLSWWAAALIGLAVGVAMTVLAAQPLLPRAGGEDSPATVPVMLVTCLAATFACWTLVRAWHFGAAPRATGAAA